MITRRLCLSSRITFQSAKLRCLSLSWTTSAFKSRVNHVGCRPFSLSSIRLSIEAGNKASNELLDKINDIPIERYRNFSIVAHVVSVNEFGYFNIISN